MAVIFGNDKNLIDKAEHLYLQSSTIHLTQEEQVAYEESKDDFTKFLDGDIREKRRKTLSFSLQDIRRIQHAATKVSPGPFGKEFTHQESSSSENDLSNSRS